MREFPAPIHKAMAALSKLPGVGPKTALRYVFALLDLPLRDREILAQSVLELGGIKRCTTCFSFSEEPTCEICSDQRREINKLCVVAESRDISTIEATGAYHGRYFVLGGRLNPIEGQTPETLNVRRLLDRIEAHPEVQEVILAFSPDVHGETTILFLARQLKSMNRRTTRLARGLPMGADIEYTDEVTLGDAMTGRRDA
ncbi:MAG: recombination mediator RecR [Patescibacteria group bacterium]|jgi:recombination protein RecR